MGQPTTNDVTIPHPEPNPNAQVQPQQSNNPTIQVVHHTSKPKLPPMHQPMHRCHAWRGLPVNQNISLTPPNIAPSALHDTAAILFCKPNSIFPTQSLFFRLQSFKITFGHLSILGRKYLKLRKR